MKSAIVVQARMNSTRLPGKVLKTVLGKPLLEYQIERLRRVRLADGIIVATTINDGDQPIIDLCNRLSVHSYRGPEFDVLARYYGAAATFGADLIVRVTSDCPVIDPQVVDGVIAFYLDHRQQYDYVANTLARTYPRGMDTEAFSFRALSEAHSEATAEPDREHVTPFIYRNDRRYRLANVSYREDQSRHRWTVDTEDDFELIGRIIGALYPRQPEFSLEDILDLLAEHPDWPEINEHVEQKKYGQ
ncbi:MAG: glycosyltransferase family protein [Thermacetogeniaceae bacterium]